MTLSVTGGRHMFIHEIDIMLNYITDYGIISPPFEGQNLFSLT